MSINSSSLWKHTASKKKVVVFSGVTHGHLCWYTLLCHAIFTHTFVPILKNIGDFNVCLLPWNNELLVLEPSVILPRLVSAVGQSPGPMALICSYLPNWSSCSLSDMLIVQNFSWLSSFQSKQRGIMVNHLPHGFS